MDEIDAALDFRNVSIVANYIKDRTKNAQFIIISLRYANLNLLMKRNLILFLGMICSSSANDLSAFTKHPIKREVLTALWLPPELDANQFI
jgi:Fe-S cluster assembly ATPase SufC